MRPAESAPIERAADLADAAVALVRRWLAESAEQPPDAGAARLAALLKDPEGLEFTLGFVDRVVRPEDLRVAGRNFEKLSRVPPTFLPWYLRAAVLLGGGFAPVLPWPVVPLARWLFRRMVGHLVIDARPKRLETSLARLRERGIRLNLNLLGEAVLGDGEAARRLAGIQALLERDDVDYVSVKVSSIAGQFSPWGLDEAVELIATRLTPLYRFAANSPTAKFINLDMEEYRDLELTIAVFKRLLDQPELANLEAGIVLQAYLPDALPALRDLTEWARGRRAAGGAGIKVRVVKGANLPLEKVDALLHGWPLATWHTKAETDASYKRLLDQALRPEHTDAVRIGIAGHNLFDLAFAWLLAKQRNVERRVEFELLLGMATGQAAAVAREVGGVRLYTPVVHPAEFDSAISYLVRRLEENASDENFMSGVFELGASSAVFDREEQRFRASLRRLDDPVPETHRVSQLHVPLAPSKFANQPDTDPSVAENRRWARAVLERSARSELGVRTVEASRISTAPALERVIAVGTDGGLEWAARPAAERSAVLRKAAEALAAARRRLIEVMASEAGKTIAEADTEVSEAVDFARYYADRVGELERVENASWRPPRLTVVTPPWNFPVAIPAGGVLAALAAGSAVILKPASLARGCGAVLAEALWEAGVPRSVLQLVQFDDRALGRGLVAHPAVERVILTGSYETARLFRSWRPDLPLTAETSGKNAIVVTPSADLDLAVSDIVRSAFGHAGQKCSAASLVILVGAVARSERFARQLRDAASSLRLGQPQSPATQLGPLIEPAHGKLLSALTTLGDGEEWLLAPQRVAAAGQGTGELWSPGIRTGVQPGSEFHLTEYFGPVLGVMTAETLDEAIALQNAVPYGLTAGIHSLDADEVANWLDAGQAGNLYVNRAITGAIVRRQPFGGWKRSSVGAGSKAGGPNYVLGLGSWLPVERDAVGNILLPGISARVREVIELSQSGLEFAEFDRVRTAAQSDERAWTEEYAASRDVSGLGVERNVFRYRPAHVTLRLSEGEPLGHLVRLIAAAARTGSSVDISSWMPLPTPLVQSFDTFSPPAAVRSTAVESDAQWLRRLPGASPERIRLVGGDPAALVTVLDPEVGVYSGPVTTSGRIELLPFLREQAVSITAHRFGHPQRAFAELPV